MRTMLQIVALVIFLAGCSGQAAFEKEILGAPPAPPPPATAAGSNVAARPGERDLGSAPAPMTGEAAQPGAVAPQPSVSTTVPQDVAPSHQPVPSQPQPGAAQSASPYAAPAQTSSPYTPPAQTASPYAAPAQTPAQAPAGRGALVFQVGSFAHEANAVSLRDVLVTRGHESYLEQGQTAQGKTYYRVYARMKGGESEARAALIALGVSEPRLVSGAQAPATRPASPAPAAPAPAAPAAPAPAAPAPAAAAPVKPAAAPSTITGPTGECHVDAERISTVGAGRADAGEPLMAQKAAAQNAKRNLLLCVDAYKRKQEKIPASIKMEGYLPETLVTYTSPAYLADGTVEVGASMAIRDVDAVAFTRVE